MYKLAVVIGRFQPIHNGHLTLFNKAKSIAKDVLCLVGSSNVSPNIKNPFNFHDREMLINRCVGDRVVCEPINDYLYDDARWAREVDLQIRSFCENYCIKPNDVCVVGYSKDESSYYLSMFPQYNYESAEREHHIDATQVREFWYKGLYDKVRELVPERVSEFLFTYDHKEYTRLKEENNFIFNYKLAWETAPYPVTFQTVDAVVVRSNHVLLVQRRSAPGQGLWALPGGFLNQKETLLKGAMRELVEETRLSIPEKVLVGSLAGEKTFDHPGRSLRGRTITNAFYFKLPDGPLDKVKGSDDAIKAKWVHLNQLYEYDMYEDHFSIISHFTGV